MPYFDKNRETKKVQLSGDYWVLLRHLTVEESRSLGNTQAMRHGTEEEKDAAMSQAGMTSLVLGILDWNLDEPDGQKATIDEAHIQKMPQPDFMKLSEAFSVFEGITKSPDARFPSGAEVGGGAESGGAGGAAAVPTPGNLVAQIGAPS
jgi:hypothetical protein